MENVSTTMKEMFGITISEGEVKEIMGEIPKDAAGELVPEMKIDLNLLRKY